MAERHEYIWGSEFYVPHIARESLAIYPKPKPTYVVTVTADSITCVPEGFSPQEAEKRAIQYHFSDIIGCDCLRGTNTGDCNAYLVLYAYPHRRKLASKKTSRRRETLTLMFDQRVLYEENQQAANAWRVMVDAILQGFQIRSFSGEYSCELSLVSLCFRPRAAESFGHHALIVVAVVVVVVVIIVSRTEQLLCSPLQFAGA